MKVACFCGVQYETPGSIGICPSCGREARIPTLRNQRWEAQMRSELDRIVAEHGVTELDSDPPVCNGETGPNPEREDDD